MNALNDDWSNIQILEIKILEELQKLIKNLLKNLILKIQNFQQKVERFIK